MIIGILIVLKRGPEVTGGRSGALIDDNIGNAAAGHSRGIVDVVQIDGNRRRIALAFAVVGRHHERRRRVHLEVEQIAVGHRNLAGRGIDGEGRRARRAEILQWVVIRIGANHRTDYRPVGRILAQAIKRLIVNDRLLVDVGDVDGDVRRVLRAARVFNSHIQHECSLRLEVELCAVLDGDVAVGGDLECPAPAAVAAKDREGMRIIDVDVSEGDFTHQGIIGTVLGHVERLIVHHRRLVRNVGHVDGDCRRIRQVFAVLNPHIQRVARLGLVIKRLPDFQRHNPRAKADVKHGLTIAAEHVEFQLAVQMITFRIKDDYFVGGGGGSVRAALGDRKGLVVHDGRGRENGHNHDQNQQQGGQQRSRTEKGGFILHDAPALLVAPAAHTNFEADPNRQHGRNPEGTGPTGRRTQWYRLSPGPAVKMQ